MHRASVLPVTLRSEVAVGSSDTSAAELATTGLTDDLVSVQPMVPDIAAAVLEKPTASSERRVTGRTDALWSDVPMPTQKLTNG